MTRLLRLNSVLFIVAAIVVLVWIRLAGGFDSIAGLAAAQPLQVVTMLGLTAACVLIRFFRWQFLMRHAGSRLIERPSLLIYLASLVGTATPAYVGEAVRGAFIKRRFGVPLKISLSVLVIERLMDVLALSLLAGVVAGEWWMRSVMALFFLGAIAGLFVVALFARTAGASTTVLRVLRRRDVMLDAFALSLAAWTVTAFHVSLAASALGISIQPIESLRVFASSILMGGLTLMPAGIGSSGALAIVQLESAGVALADAFLVVSLVRLTTVGATLMIGAVCLLWVLRGEKSESSGDAAEHFDEIATEYGDQFQQHVWEHLLERKVGLIASALPPAGQAGKGLDLGCGLGSQCLALARRGYTVYGMEIATNLAAQARRAGVSVAAGSALELPFADKSLDFVYAVGVLHHLPNRQAQRVAFAEVARVLRPGGVFIIHETNTRNPLFRFYMGYVFPLLKKIDEGIEWWIEPDRLKTVTGLKLVDVSHFTFMPDFVPSFLMKPVLAIDRWLERTWLRPYSVHYMAVLKRDASWAPAVDQRFADEERASEGFSWSAANETSR